MTLAVRPDLSERTALSKSTLTGFDMCGTKAWYSIHDRRPLILSEKIVFGSALDAAVEQLMTAARAGIPLEQAKPLLAAEEVMARDGIELDLAQIGAACGAFVRDIMPHHDFRMAGLQANLHEDIEGIGEVDGHPDVRLADGSIYDVKSSSRAKPTDAAATSVELGIYGLLSEAESGRPCPRVGYWTWVRTQRPYWQPLEVPFTDEMRRRTRAVAMAYVRAKAADDLLNRGAKSPINFSMTAGPKNVSLCNGCQYSPAFDGPCQLAVQGGSDD